MYAAILNRVWAVRSGHLHRIMHHVKLDYALNKELTRQQENYKTGFSQLRDQCSKDIYSRCVVIKHSVRFQSLLYMPSTTGCTMLMINRVAAGAAVFWRIYVRCLDACPLSHETLPRIANYSERIADSALA